MVNEISRQISLERADILKTRIEPYLEAIKEIRCGLYLTDEIKDRQRKIKEKLNANEEEWNNWHWQIRNRIVDSDKLAEFINLNEKQKLESML